jgi:acetylxylan esterase
MYPTFNGSYPKMQVWNGTADNFVNYLNLAEEVKEWSGVLGVSWVKNVTDSPQSGYS